MVHVVKIVIDIELDGINMRTWQNAVINNYCKRLTVSQLLNGLSFLVIEFIHIYFYFGQRGMGFRVLITRFAYSM